MTPLCRYDLLETEETSSTPGSLWAPFLCEVQAIHWGRLVSQIHVKSEDIFRFLRQSHVKNQGKKDCFTSVPLFFIWYFLRIPCQVKKKVLKELHDIFSGFALIFNAITTWFCFGIHCTILWALTSVYPNCQSFLFPSSKQWHCENMGRC